MVLARALLLLCLSATPALALEPCFADSTGDWRGPVHSGPRISPMDTHFRAAPDGTLSGTYHVYDPEPFDGTLTGFHITAPCEADFTWTDRYGQGVVHVRFEPELGRFRGLWGMTAPKPGYIFEGYRDKPAPVS
jgi:hypothetical protein